MLSGLRVWKRCATRIGRHGGTAQRLRFDHVLPGVRLTSTIFACGDARQPRKHAVAESALPGGAYSAEPIVQPCDLHFLVAREVHRPASPSREQTVEIFNRAGLKLPRSEGLPPASISTLDDLLSADDLDYSTRCRSCIASRGRGGRSSERGHDSPVVLASNLRMALMHRLN